MSFQALGKMLGGGSLSPERAARQGLVGATSDSYRAQYPEEFDLILRWRLADSSSLSDYYQQMMAGTRFDAAFAVRNIASPTLVIHGTEDRYVPVANAAALAEAIPNATLRVIDYAGHLVFIEQADEVNDEIISFLEPFERRPYWRLTATQKAKRLMQRAGEANEKVFYVFKAREPHETDDTGTPQVLQERLAEEQEHRTLAKLKGWLWQPFLVTSAWTRKLCDRLSR